VAVVASRLLTVAQSSRPSHSANTIASNLPLLLPRVCLSVCLSDVPNATLSPDFSQHHAAVQTQR